MGQQASTALNFCCTACSVCPCCSRSDYSPLDTLGIMDDPPHPKTHSGSDYQSNGLNPNHVPNHPSLESLDHLDDTMTHRDERTKFRAFVIAYNKQYGYLLLRAFKKGKGLHHQLPGGHLDKSEMVGVSFEEAAKRAALRELYEETGLKVDGERLKFLKLGIKNRVYFQLLLTMEDSLHHDAEYDEISNLTISLQEDQEFYLKISHEHNGFVFEKDIGTAIQMIQQHSGGKNSEALTVYAQKAKHEKRSRSRTYSNSTSKSHKKSVSRRKSSSSSSSSGGRKRKRKKRTKEDTKQSPRGSPKGNPQGNPKGNPKGSPRGNPKVSLKDNGSESPKAVKSMKTTKSMESPKSVKKHSVESIGSMKSVEAMDTQKGNESKSMDTEAGTAMESKGLKTDKSTKSVKSESVESKDADKSLESVQTTQSTKSEKVPKVTVVDEQVDESKENDPASKMQTVVLGTK